MPKIGCCGWNRFPEKGDRLANYAKVFDVVEVNSTFYRLPRISTVQRWRDKADEINPDFEFTVKVWKKITHEDVFSSEVSMDAFEKTKEIAKALCARFLLFQSPASFKPTRNNIMKAKRFFSKINREKFILGWEVRWAKEWTEDIVTSLFEELDLEHVVDPFRQESFRKKVGYYRLHGFGKRMYDYTFSDEELRKLMQKTKNAKNSYIFFNNFTMYEDAKRFLALL